MGTQTILTEKRIFHYVDRVTVKHTNFLVAEGVITAFLGPNGAGKSNIIKFITGQLKPNEGRAILLD